MKRILFTLPLLCLAGCSQPIAMMNAPNNPTIQIGFLFENDGVKMYRFHDEYGMHYYADTRGEVTSPRAKGRTETIPTVK